MSEVMKIVLALTISGTVLAGALALLRRLLKNKLPQAVFYYLWLLVLLRLIVPVAVPLPQAWRPHQTEAAPVTPQQEIQIDPGLSDVIQQAQNQLPPESTDQQWEIVVPSVTMPSTTPTQLPSSDPWHEQLWDILCGHFLIIWLGGAVIHFLWFALSYLRFCRRLKDNCTPLWEHEQALLEQLRGKQKVTACRSPLAGTPMLVGLLRHRIILPEEDISTRQLECILRHELTHLRRRDLLHKWFAVAATSLHWFNPLMPWLRREIARCCELSCDEAVVSGMDDRQKQWYGETLLALASLHALPRAVPATTLCEEKAQLKERLLGIMKYKKATALILLLSGLLAVLIAGCAAVLGPQKPVTELPQASDYALWINAADQDVFVRNWKVEYHDGTHVASVHMAPADYDGDEYVFRGRDLPELRARVEAWAFTELPLDRENCILYYRMEPDLLMATSSQVTVFPLDGGEPVELALPDLDMTTYCGHVTITDLRDNEQWLLVLTDADRMPQLSQQTEPLTAEEQAEVLEELRIWAEEHLEKEGEISLEFQQTVENPAHLGFYTMVGGTHLYDLTKREVRDVDGTYPDAEQLGVVFLSLKEGDSLKDWRAFYLTYGDPAKATPSINALEQAASGYANGTVTEVCWWQQNSLSQYIRVDFDLDGKGYAFEYSALSGRWSVEAQEKPRQKDSALKMAHLPALLESITGWQEKEGTDKENYQLAYQPEFLKRTAVVDTLDQFLKDAWENRAVYDIYSEKTSRLEGNYTGSQDYGYFSLMYPAENARQWVYLVDNADPDPDLSGRVAVVLEDTPLENARVETVDSEGRTIRMDMAVTLKKGDLVYVESREPGSCTVSVLAGEPPRPYGQLSPDLLSGDGRDLRQANQVILNNTEGYADDHNTVIGTYSGVANVEYRDMTFWKVSLPGGGEPFWVCRVDLTWEWPIAVAQSPENLSYADLQNYYMDFAMDWRVDFIPDFDHNSYSGRVSSQDFLMLTWYQNRDNLPEDRSMTAALVEQVMESQFGIESVQHESLFKTWNWDAEKEKYLPVPQGVADDSLFDVVTFNAAERWVDGALQMVYSVTLRYYAYPFLEYGGSYADLVDYTLGPDSAYGDNIQFLLDCKGNQLKSGEISPETALRQMILEGNTAGFTKGNEIRLEYYMTENGPRFLYKSERIFDFTPGAVYENAAMGFRLTLPVCWEGKYRIQEQENSVRIDDAWGGTLCTIFRSDAAQFAADGGEDNIPVPHRVLGQNGQYVWLMYFASDVQYDPGNQEQTAAYLAMYQDLKSLPFHILDTSSDWQSAAQDKILSFLAAQYPEATAPQMQAIPADDPSTVATLQMMTTETYSYDLNTGEIVPLRQSVPDSAQLGGLFVRDESGQYRKEWMFLFTRQGPQITVSAADGLAALASRYPNADVSRLETFLHDGMDVWQQVVFDTGAQAYTYSYGGALGAVEMEETDARGTGKLPLSDLPGLLDAIAAWQRGFDTAHNAKNYSLALQTNPRFLEAALRQNWAGIAVYDIATGTMCEHIGAYTGTGEYGYITVLGPAKSPSWLYIIEDSAAYAASLGYDEVRYERRPDDSRGFRFLLARKGDHWGLLDGQGKTLLSPETYELDAIALNTYEEVWPLFRVQKDGLWGAVDHRGNLVIEPKWQQVMMFIYDEPKTVYLSDGTQWYAAELTYESYTDVYTYTELTVGEPRIPEKLLPDLQGR